MGDREPLRDASASYLRKVGSVASTFYNDENNSGAEGAVASSSSSSGFAELSQAFNQRITELQQLMCLRIEDHAKHLFAADLRGLDASVRALERVFKEIREHAAREAAAVPKARALLQAARTQQQALAQIAANLPAHLPGAPGGIAAAAGGGSFSSKAAGAAADGGAAAPGLRRAASAAAADDAPAAAGRRRDTAAGGAAAGGGAAAASTASAAASASAVVAPRWYVTQAELASLASYMRGRLTLDRVNAALDEAALHAEQLARWMGAVRAHQLSRVPADERKRAADIFHMLANKDGVRGQYFFTETELKSGVALRPDKTGKALLTVLRHLGRVNEVRANVEALGGPLVVYVLARPA